MSTLIRLSALPLLFLIVNCGGNDPSKSTSPLTSPASCDEKSQGFTTCDVATCQPGQYCFTDNGGFQNCQNGCLSDVNCACDQHCVQSPGKSVGVCMSTTSSTSCGDGACNGGETSQTCAMDCPPAAKCGDGVCNGGETSQTCAMDCKPATTCGDAVCSAGEDANTCPEDCPNVSGCKTACDNYNFFSCFTSGALQSCYDACQKATVAQIKQFTNCASTGEVHCDTSCLSYLP